MLLFKGSRDQLLVPLHTVSGVVEKRTTLPILSNVLIERARDKLSFLATDIEMQIHTAAQVEEVTEIIALTVGARKLQDILRSLPENAEVSMTLIDKRLELKAGKSRFTLQTLPAADFPRMVINDSKEIQLTLKQSVLKRLFSLVQYAMAQQDIRYYLNGLLLVVDGAHIRFVATDGHRLAYASEKLDASQNIGDMKERLEVILPRKSVQELCRQLGDSDDTIQIKLTATQVQFLYGQVTMSCKLIDGKFPDYERVIPRDQARKFSIEREAFFHAMQRVAILTSDKFRGIRVMIDKGSLKIVSSNTEQEEAQEELEIDYQGEAVEIGFNVTYLIDMLSNVNTETIECRINDGNSSALFLIPERDDFKYVVMPMRI